MLISRVPNVAAHATRRAARVAAVGAAVASAGTAPHVLLAGALRTSLLQITADHFISLVGVLCSVPLAFALPSLNSRGCTRPVCNPGCNRM